MCLPVHIHGQEQHISHSKTQVLINSQLIGHHVAQTMERFYYLAAVAFVLVVSCDRAVS